MKVLLDTHLLIWSVSEPKRLPGKTRRLLEDQTNQLYFSVVSLWEVGVKRSLNRPDFTIDPRLVREQLLATGFEELTLSAAHVLAVERLPALHRDPFDRLLLCQCMVERLTLLTEDKQMLAYPLSVRSQ